MEELERTYLAKKVSVEMLAAPSKEILDIYLPSTTEHPVLRLRKSGSSFEMTKKQPVVEGDASRQIETTIPLTEAEFAELNSLQGKRVHKIRYYYLHEGIQYEIDVFQDALQGLVLVDVEFSSIAEKDAFIAPDFCLVEVTQEKFIAGGILCGKSYGDIEKQLQQFSYQKI